MNRTAPDPTKGIVLDPSSVPPAALLRKLELRVHKRVDGRLNGEYRSAALGQGTELAQLRPYTIGDDVRDLDWNATARTGEPHVRVHVAERALTTWMVIDESASMGFGTQDHTKADIAHGVALALAHTASKHVNRIGVMTFGGPDLAATRPPAQGRVGLLGVMEALGRATHHGPPAEELASVLGRLGRVAKGRCLVIVISDLRGPRDWKYELGLLAHKHTVVVIEPRDRREMEIPDVGEVEFLDPETGEVLRVDTRHSGLREEFQTEAAKERTEVRADVLEAGAEHVVLTTTGDWLAPLASFLELRDRNRR